MVRSDRAILTAGGAHRWLAERRGEVFFGGGVAGIYNIATQVEFRRRGLGGALTTAAVNATMDEGYPDDGAASLAGRRAGLPPPRFPGPRPVHRTRDHAMNPPNPRLPNREMDACRCPVATLDGDMDAYRCPVPALLVGWRRAPAAPNSRP